MLVPVPKEPTDQTDPVPALPVITGLRIKGVTSQMKLGDWAVLHASVLSADGEEVDTEGLSWESTDAKILRVNPVTGQLNAVGAGSASVTASQSDVSTSIKVTVAPAPAREEVSVGADAESARPDEGAALRAAVPSERETAAVVAEPRPDGSVLSRPSPSAPERKSVSAWWLLAPVVVADAWFAFRPDAAPPAVPPARVVITSAEGQLPPQEGWALGEGEELLLAAAALDAAGGAARRYRGLELQ